ncbi:MAG TPA: hypothetical protein VFJ63_00180 [Candidatus Bathyarchaeia archaeon]|nr:hypothetical protein [Candidatus Bathyarchaeia archaeon]
MLQFQLRKFRAATILILGIMMVLVAVPGNVHATASLQGTDFQAQSFSKVVDYYDYVRSYAAQQGYNISSIQNQHAYIYTTYINVGGFQLFYAGLLNATHNGMNVTVPIQTVFEHFKTPAGKDAITASSFLSLVAFRENGTSTIFPNSPDRNDTVFASFSLGYTLSAFGTHPVPTYVAGAQIIPLTSTDSNHWTWGLNYTNLNSIWWRIYPDPLLPQWDASTPRAFAQYSQLSFNYALTIDPTAKTATLTTSYTVGRITDLYLLTATPQVLHLNATGTYNLNGQPRAPGQTVYQYLAQNGYKLSIVQSHMAILASTTTHDNTTNGSGVDNNNETDVTHTAVNTLASDNEEVFSTNFGVKPSYQLYNYTNSNQATNYNVTTRTASRPAWGGNPVYSVQNAFMGFLPLFVYHVDPSLFIAARSGMANFKVASYLYITSYPTWSGYKIVNDPQFTAFYQPAGNLGLLTIIFVAIAVAAGIGGVFAFLFRKRRSSSVSMTGSTVPAQTPGPMPGPTGPAQ